MAGWLASAGVRVAMLDHANPTSLARFAQPIALTPRQLLSSRPPTVAECRFKETTTAGWE